MNLKEIKNYYHDNKKLYHDIIKNFENDNISKSFPVANVALKDLSESVELIISSMLQNAKSENLYTIAILYRALIEHFFKAFYIFAKTIKEESDETAEKFIKHYFISEILAEQGGFMEIENIINKSDNKDFLKYIVSKIPELEGFDKENQKEISQAIKQFGLKDIIKFFYSSSKENERIPNSHIFLKMIPEYSKFSSFVHGGPYAFNQLKEYSKNSTLAEEIERIVEISIISYICINQSVITTYIPGKHLLEALEAIKKNRR